MSRYTIGPDIDLDQEEVRDRAGRRRGPSEQPSSYIIESKNLYKELRMAITTIDINEEYLEGARRVLGTTTKVETVNQALKSVSNRAKRQELVEMLASADRVELDVIQEAWR